MIGRVALITVAALVALPIASVAHVMPEGQGSTRLVENKAYTLISVPTSVLTVFDDDRNGAISVAEAYAHRDNLQAQIERLVTLSDGTTLGKTVYSDLNVPHFDSSSAVQSKAVIHIRVSEWTTPPKSLHLKADVFGWMDRELYFRAIMGDSTEAFTLTPSDKQHVFFDPAPKTSPSALLRPGLVLAGLLALTFAIWRARL